MGPLWSATAKCPKKHSPSPQTLPGSDTSQFCLATCVQGSKVQHPFWRGHGLTFSGRVLLTNSCPVTVLSSPISPRPPTPRKEAKHHSLHTVFVTSADYLLFWFQDLSLDGDVDAVAWQRWTERAQQFMSNEQQKSKKASISLRQTRGANKDAFGIMAQHLVSTSLQCCIPLHSRHVLLKYRPLPCKLCGICFSCSAWPYHVPTGAVHRQCTGLG